MKIITIEREAIDTFKDSWQCHGLPENLDLIVAAFAPNGDLVDYDLCDKNDNVIETDSYWVHHEGSGSLAALLDDAQEHATKNPVIPGTISTGYTFAAYPESK